MIFSSKYPKLEKRGETIDLKYLGSSTFGLMKQNRKGKFMFEGKFPLVKFGKFAEVSDPSTTESSSAYKEFEDDVITASEHEEDPINLVAIVAEEHVPISNDEANEYENADDDEEEGNFEKGLMYNIVKEDYEEDVGFGDMSALKKDDISFSFEHGEY